MATSLSEKLAELINPAPVFFDPEDDVNIETAAHLVDKFEDEPDDTVTSSKLRVRNATLLADEDQRYAGKRSSRRSLKIEKGEIDSDSESRSDAVGSDGIEDDNDDYEAMGGAIDVFKSQFKSFQEKAGTRNESDSDDNDNDEEQENDSDTENEKDMKSSVDDDDEGNLLKSQLSDEEEGSKSDGSEEEYSDLDNEAKMEDDEGESFYGASWESFITPTLPTNMKDDVVQNFSKVDISGEVEKGKATRAQLTLCDSALEWRIKLQSGLRLANQLPRHDTLPQFRKAGDKEFRKVLSQTEKSVEALLGKLVQLQTVLLQMNPETKHVLSEAKSPKDAQKPTPKDDDDEEIPSDTDEEQMADEVDNQDSIVAGLKRKLSMEDYPEFLVKRHKAFENYRNSTIQKWSERTRLTAGKLNRKSYSAAEQSTLKQIEQILNDKGRLIRRTQLKRAAYRVLGKPEAEKKEEDQASRTELEAMPKQNDQEKDYDPEVFDDDDFYHQLLRDLIERRTADVQDPLALSRQWLEIQKLRSKMKRKVDTKASKGRKIRYDPHSKLTNFMAPVDNCSMTDEARNELFSSLFGNQKSVTVISKDDDDAEIDDNNFELI